MQDEIYSEGVVDPYIPTYKSIYIYILYIQTELHKHTHTYPGSCGWGWVPLEYCEGVIDPARLAPALPPTRVHTGVLHSGHL